MAWQHRVSPGVRLAPDLVSLQTDLALAFVDQGPGIADVSLALTDGCTSGGGKGPGLSGAKRLADVFKLQTWPGIGITVKIIKWKPY